MKNLREHEMDIERWNVCYIDEIREGSKKKKGSSIGHNILSIHL